MSKESEKMNANGPVVVDARWLKDHIEDPEIRIIDTRSSIDYRKGHVKNSLNIQISDLVKAKRGLPAMCSSKEDIESLLSSKGIGNQTFVIAYDNFGGIFASRLLWTLEYYGHERIGIFNGSIKRWLDAGEEFTRKIPKVQKTDFCANPNERRTASIDWVLGHIDDPKVKFLDVRTKDEFAGKTAYGARGGHIPRAVNVHWLEAIDTTTGAFKSNDELKAIYESKGITRGKEIVTYCWMGLRASHGYSMLRVLGYPFVRNYDASWSEWGEIESLAIER